MKKNPAVIAALILSAFFLVSACSRGKNPISPLPENPVAAPVLGSQWVEATSAAGFTPRVYDTSLVFNNEMWVIGGEGATSTNPQVYFSDVWNSRDGANWTQATATAGFSVRFEHTSVVYNNQMWVIGGVGHNGCPNVVVLMNDVWSSSDGANWTQVTATAAFSPRQFLSGIVYNNQMWVIGGEDGTNFSLNDVWSSSDGATWTQVTGTAGFNARTFESTVVFNNRMWVIGGQGNTDAWSSSDGANWAEATGTAAFGKRSGQSCVVYDNKIWLIGGYYTSAYEDVWSSSDGATWTQVTGSAAFGPRISPTSVVYNNKMWLIAGDSNSTLLNDVWHSQ